MVQGPEGDINEQGAHLLARIAMRDRAAFETLYRLVSGKLNAVALRMLGAPEVAADVLQESFMQIWHNAGSYRRDQGEPLAWMRAIVRYRALDHLQSGKRRREDFPGDDELHQFHDQTATGQPEVQSELDGQRHQLDLCLGQLSGSMRESVTLAYYYGHSREEISQRLHTPINTVKSWLKRGLERLELCLRQSAI